MSLVAVTCSECGGLVAMEEGRSNPRCLFCGRESLRPVPLPEGVEPPRGHLPFRVDKRGVHAAFVKFAKSSIWHPGDLRGARVRIEPVFVAAWAWEADVETHWAAMFGAMTRSGVRPMTGSQTVRATTLVAASSMLTRAELAALGAFELGDAQAFDPADPPGAHEIGTLTRSSATAEARASLARSVEAELGRNAKKLSASHLIANATGAPVLLPVWVGAFRWHDKLHRILVHGQTGKLVGKGPVSLARVLGAIALGVLLAAFLIGLLRL